MEKVVLSPRETGLFIATGHCLDEITMKRTFGLKKNVNLGRQY